MTHRYGDRPAETWSDEAVLRESARWVHVPSSGVRIDDRERLLVLLPASGGPSRVWRSWLESTGAEALIQHTIEETRAHGGRRLVWHTGDAVSPPFMDESLTEHGFAKTEELEVLAFDLGANAQPRLPNLHAPPDIRVRTVEDEADLRRAHAIETKIFPASTADGPDVHAYLLGLSALERGKPELPGADNVPRAVRHLASVRNRRGGGWEAIATAGAELTGETVRLWGAGTLPGFRGRGAYRALVTARCRYAHARGATLALTKANAASSVPILRAAGFRTVATERRYARSIAP